MTPIVCGTFTFIRFEPGTFLRGALDGDPHQTTLETPLPTAITRPFCLQVTPVTVGQYHEFVSRTRYPSQHRIEVWDGSQWIEGPTFQEANGKGDLYPVVGVSYHDALAFSHWASAETGIELRLPTEAEFEYAAKFQCGCREYCRPALALKGTDAVRPEGSNLPGRLAPVDRAPVSASGLRGMHGTVWQWCSDWFFHYGPDEHTDPSGPTAMPPYAPWRGEQWPPGRVIRGGSFSYPYFHSRCSNRHYSKEGDRNYNLGFRLAFSAPAARAAIGHVAGAPVGVGDSLTGGSPKSGR